MNPQQQNTNAYTQGFMQTDLPTEEVELFNLSLPDEKLQKMLIDELERDVDFWNQKPWDLQTTDVENTNFLLGDQLGGSKLVNNDVKFQDNRMFAATRAILSYATGQLAVPEITPSRSDDTYLKMARSIQAALYQHSADEKVDQKTRAAVMNLVARKRGGMKLRYDQNAGLYGDIVTEVWNPEDVIIDRFAQFMKPPNKIYHRLRCTVDELCAKFPKKEQDIRTAYGIIQGRYSQMSRYVTYFECWFTYIDKGVPREGLCWFINEPSLILDKVPNPNWIYTGDDQKDKQQNVMSAPPKPFTWLNYLNMGHSYIDETCLFDQGKPLQVMLNKRGQQFSDNIDYANGRWIANKKAMSEEDAQKMVNKGSKTIALVDSDDVTKSFANVAAQSQPAEVFNSMLDLRNEIDTMMGTPAVFRGEQPTSKNTLGRDLLVKQGAGALQDDLVRAVSLMMEDYYKIKLQMMCVYYTDDYWFQVKGGDGKFDFIMLNGDVIDANVKIGVQVDSTLPLDKEKIRATAESLLTANKIDYLTAMEDMGLPNPEVRTERFLRSQVDPIGYLASVEQQLDNNDAEIDIMLLTAGKMPQERDDYDENYLNYFNHYVATNKFQTLPPDAQQRITAYLMVVQHLAQQSASLQATTLDDAGITTGPITPPLPKKTVQIRLAGDVQPNTAEQLAEPPGAPPPPPPPTQ